MTRIDQKTSMRTANTICVLDATKSYYIAHRAPAILFGAAIVAQLMSFVAVPDIVQRAIAFLDICGSLFGVLIVVSMTFGMFENEGTWPSIRSHFWVDAFCLNLALDMLNDRAAGDGTLTTTCFLCISNQLAVYMAKLSAEFLCVE